MFREGRDQGIIRVEFGRDQWAGVKGILEWVVLVFVGDQRVFQVDFWGGFSGGMVRKWWEGIAGFLGELGGAIGREIEAWKGNGLLEKKEGVLL